jgi:hypothetical protein
VRANVASATIWVDGAGPQRGQWTGDVGAGAHHVIVVADGYVRQERDVSVLASQSQELPVTLAAVPPLPPPPEQETEGERGEAPRREERRWYGLIGLAGEGEQLDLEPALVTSSSAGRQNFGGGSFVLKGGYALSRHFSLEVDLDFASVTTSSSAGHATLGSAGLAPEIILHTSGKLRALGGFGLGIEGIGADAAVNGVDHKASMAAMMALLELGGELRFSRLFLRGTFFLDVHDVSRLTEGSTGQRFFTDSTAGRAGLRFMLGYAF